MNAEEVEITKELIDSIISRLPKIYVKELAKTRYGTATAKDVRKIKNWRAGLMKDSYESQKIYAAAEKLEQKCRQELADFKNS